MLTREAAAIEALRMLAGGKALTEEGRVAAGGALVAIEARVGCAEPALPPGGGEMAGGHVMISYQWNVQPTIER